MRLLVLISPPKDAFNPMPLSFILSRIAVRTGVAIWRHRLAWLAATLLVSAFGVYQLSFAGPSVSNGDCADTTMAAITRVDDQVARAAYACLDPGMRKTSEEQFVSDLRQRDAARGHVSRVAEQRTTDGGRLVFYTVQGRGPTIGYIVYLDARGRVVKVE
jgi:hypothetical protein